MTQQPQLRKQDCMELLCHDLSQFCNKCLATWWHEDKVLLGSTPWFYLSVLRKPKHLLDSLHIDNRKKSFCCKSSSDINTYLFCKYAGLHRSHLSQSCHYPFSNSTEINVRWKEELKVAFTMGNCYDSWYLQTAIKQCTKSFSPTWERTLMKSNSSFLLAYTAFSLLLNFEKILAMANSEHQNIFIRTSVFTTNMTFFNYLII